jgi:hypothetical protein
MIDSVIFNNFNDDLVGSILPNVFINKITLDEKNEPLPEVNPHVDVDREVLTTQTSKGKKIIHNGFTLENKNTSNKNLILSINLSVFNTIDKTTDDSWFKNVDIIDSIYLKVLINTSKIFYDQYVALGLPSDIKQVKDNEKTITKIVSLKEILGEVETPITNFDQKITELFYNIKIGLKNLNYEHMSVFANTYLDLDEFINKFQLNLPNNIELKGKPAIELIIENNKTNLESSLFLNSNGKVYGGDVVVQNGKYFTSNTFKPQQLNKVPVTNLKIKDKRKTTNNSNLQKLGLRKINNILNIKQSNYISDCFTSRSENGVLTSLIYFDYIETIKNNVKYSFLFDNNNADILSEALSYVSLKNIKLYRKRFFDKTSFFNNQESKLIISTSESDKKVLKYNKSFYTKYKNFIILNNNDIKNKNFASTLPSNETIDSLFKVAEISEIFLKNVEYVRCISFTDYEISKITDGSYQYELELEISDNSREFINQYYKKLLNIRNKLKFYYEKCSQNFNVSKDSLNNDFMNSLLQASQTQINNIAIPSDVDSIWLETPAIFKITSEIIDTNAVVDTESIYKLLHPKTTSPEEINDVLEMLNNLIIRYEELLDIKNDIYSNINQASKQKLVKINKLFKQVFDSNEKKNISIDFLSVPRINNKIKLPNLVDRFDKEKKKFFTSNLKPDIELQNSLNNRQVYDDLFDIDTFSTTYLTPAVIKSEVINFDILNAGESMWESENYDIINSVAISKKTNNIKLFSNKKFNLSNKIINDAGIVIEAPNDTAAIDILSKFELQFNRTNKDSSSWLGDSSPFNNSNLNIEDELCEERKEKTDNNIKLYNIDPIIKSVVTAPSNINNFIKIRNFDIKSNVNIASSFVTKKTKISNVSNVKIDNSSINKIKNKSIVISKKVNPTITNVVKTTNFIPKDEQFSFTKAMPIQIKSLMLGSNESTKKNFFELEFDVLKHPKTKNIIKYNYQTIIKLEYLSGFEISNEELNLSKPIWSLLTKNIIDNLTGQIFVKQTKYEDKSLKLITDDEDNYSILDKYFILDSEKEQQLKAVEEMVDQTPALVVNNRIVTNNVLNQVTTSLLSKNTPENEIKKQLLSKHIVDFNIEPKFIRTTRL